MNVATITSAQPGSSQLVIDCTGIADGLTILVHRGELLMGTGLVSGGSCLLTSIVVSVGDVLQASVTQRGNQCGIPYIVRAGSGEATGWLQPSVILTHSDADGTEEHSTDDITIPAIYDPIASGLSIIPPEYISQPPVELGFDVEQVEVAGKTTVRVVPRGSEALLVGWNGATPSSPASLPVLVSGPITVTVQRDDAAGRVFSRTLNVIVLPAVATTTTTNGNSTTTTVTTAATDITSAAWRNMGNYYIRAVVNCLKPCEGLLIGYTNTWLAGTMRETGFIEIDWTGPVPTGQYTCQIRVVGETNQANFTTFVVNVI